MTYGGFGMGEIFFVICFFLVSIPLVLAIVVSVYRNHIKATGNIINYDNFMKCFVYKTSLSKEEIIKALQVVNAADELKCDVDSEESTIVFSEYGESAKYFFEVKPVEDFYILKLEQLSFVATQSYISLKLNPFITKKLNAEVVPYSEYGV